MIYVLEDDDNIRKFVCYALTREGYEVLGFAKPGRLWDALTKEVPSLLLLDIMLPEEDGMSILKKLKQNGAYSDMPVIMVTAKTSEFDTVSGLDAGADDYIAKPFGMTELMSRVRAVLRRYEKTHSSGAVYKNGGLCVDTAKHTAEYNGEELSLSYKEFMLLSVLLEAKGSVVRREDLFAKVWGEYYGESRTLDVHIGKLRSKLGEAGSMIQTVKNVGYKLKKITGGSANE